MRILIADDNQINREFLKAALSDPGIETCEAVNGRDAYEQFLKQPFDLILMDIRMPEMDGIESTLAIRDAEPSEGARARIVGLTADLQLSTTTNLRQQGFDDCLAKPISRDTVRRLLTNKPASPAAPEASRFPVIDRTAALAAAGGNVELLERLMGMLQKELTTFIPTIVEAIKNNKYTEATGPVHKLRGSAGYTGCMELKQAAAQLELALTRENQSEIGTAMEDLQNAAENVKQL